jgi:hypothetical protein
MWRAGVEWVAFDAIANNADSEGWPLHVRQKGNGWVVGNVPY